MHTALTLIPLAVIIVGMVAIGARNRRRIAGTAAQRRSKLVPGASVMTTSGLYATVTAVYDDDSVLLAVAPGVQMRWAAAAVRPAESLPDQYRPAAEHPVTYPPQPGTGASLPNGPIGRPQPSGSGDQD